MLISHLKSCFDFSKLHKSGLSNIWYKFYLHVWEHVVQQALYKQTGVSNKLLVLHNAQFRKLIWGDSKAQMARLHCLFCFIHFLIWLHISDSLDDRPGRSIIRLCQDGGAVRIVAFNEFIWLWLVIRLHISACMKIAASCFISAVWNYKYSLLWLTSVAPSLLSIARRSNIAFENGPEIFCDVDADELAGFDSLLEFVVFLGFVLAFFVGELWRLSDNCLLCVLDVPWCVEAFVASAAVPELSSKALFFCCRVCWGESALISASDSITFSGRPCRTEEAFFSRWSCSSSLLCVQFWSVLWLLSRDVDMCFLIGDWS